jgi:hypothetical protein
MTLGGVNTGVCAGGGTVCAGAGPDDGGAPDPGGPLDAGPEAAAPVESEPPAPEPLPTVVSSAAEADAGPVAWPALALAGAVGAGGRGDGTRRGAGWGAATRGDAGG